MRKATLTLFMAFIALVIPIVSSASNQSSSRVEDNSDESKYGWEQLVYIDNEFSQSMNPIPNELESFWNLFPEYTGYETISSEVSDLSEERQRLYQTYIFPYGKDEDGKFVYSGGLTNDVYQQGLYLYYDALERLNKLIANFYNTNSEALDQYGISKIERIYIFYELFRINLFTKLEYEVQMLAANCQANNLDDCSNRKKRIDEIAECANNIFSLRRYFINTNESVDRLECLIEYFPSFTDRVNGLSENLNQWLNEMPESDFNNLEVLYQDTKTQIEDLMNQCSQLWEDICLIASTPEQRAVYVDNRLIYAQWYGFYIETNRVVYPTYTDVLEEYTESANLMTKEFFDKVMSIDTTSEEGFTNFLIEYSAFTSRMDFLIDMLDRIVKGESIDNLLIMIENALTELESFRSDLLYSNFTPKTNFVVYVDVLINETYRIRDEALATEDKDKLNQLADDLAQVQLLMEEEIDIADYFKRINDLLDYWRDELLNKQSPLITELNSINSDFNDFIDSFKNDDSLSYSDLKSKLREIQYYLMVFADRLRKLNDAYNGVGEIIIDYSLNNGKCYDINGIELVNPEKGQLVIRVDGSGKASKILIK